MIFYLGTHKPVWLERTAVPLFISSRTFLDHKQKRAPRALGPWALDSGAWSEFRRHGRWSFTAAQYTERVEAAAVEVGGLQWAAPMDWPCEPSVREATGLPIRGHQYATTSNLITLRCWLGQWVIPVVQGWAVDDYLRHVDEYADAGVDLTREPVVGIGSICRRGQDVEIATIIRELHAAGLSLHAFGVRSRALRLNAECLTSADSLAWSARARRDDPIPGHTHKACSNCLEYALRWRDRQLDRVGLFNEEALWTRPVVV